MNNKQMKTRIIAFVIILSCLSSCQKIILGSEEVNNPINNFEIFWHDFDRHSGIIFPKKINWDSVYQVYRPQVSELTTDEELWTIFTQMIEVFDDEHTFIYDIETEAEYVSGFAGIQEAVDAFSKDLIRQKYLDNYTPIESAPDLGYGKIKDKDIGYIYMGDVDGQNPVETMEAILSEIGQHQAIIFDVRNNGGGDGDFANLLVSAFSEMDQKVFSEQNRNGPSHDDFEPKVWSYNRLVGNAQYNKPVVVLTDRFSVSGAERTALYLRINSQITHIGDTTAGAFTATGNRRFLPNGWQFQYPAGTTLTPAGKSLDGIGLIPDVLVLSTKVDIEAGNDLILERAFSYLFETYGIK